MKNLGTIKIKISGKGVADGMVDARLLGEILINFQTLLFYVAEKVVGVKRDKTFYLKYGIGLKEIGKGSAILALSPLDTLTTLEGVSPIENSVKELIEMVKKIEKDPREGREYLLEKVEDPKDRLIVEAKVYSLWPEVGNDIALKYEGYTFSTENYISLKAEHKKIINEWLQEDMKEASRKVRGIITRIKVDGRRRYFIVLSVDGELYKFEYTEKEKDIETQILDLIKSPVEIVGITAGRAKIKQIKEILDLRPLEEIYMESIGKYKFKQKIAIKISYDAEDDLWVLQNDDLGIVGVGDTYEEALEQLEDSLQVVIEGYLHEPDEKLTEDAKELKRNLQKYMENHILV